MAESNFMTESDVRELASAQSFERGYRYFRDGSVFEIIRRGDLVSAKVEGSEYEPYRVQLIASRAGNVGPSCTCPYDWGGICKHIVATFLVVIHEPEAVVEKPALSTLLGDLTADQLRRVLMGVAEEGPDFAEAIEREVGWLTETAATGVANSAALQQEDVNAARRDIRRGLRPSKVYEDQYDYYDEYDGLEMDPGLVLLPHLGKVEALLDAGDVETAVAFITAIIESYVDGLTDLDDWVYEYNMDVFVGANLVLGEMLAQVLLSLDMQPKQREEWLAQIADWEDALGDLDIAETAVKQGWSYSPLVEAMQGNITAKGAWEDEAPYYADELTQARLRVLARQGRLREYVNLAEAEGQPELAINMLAYSGETDNALAKARSYLNYPQQILSLVHVLVEKGELEAALDIAEFGLSLEEELGMIELARWTRKEATNLGKHSLALEAAKTAFTSSYELADYKAVQNLANDNWQAIKSELLKSLKECWSASQKIDIYLHENMIAESMQVLDVAGIAYDSDLQRVIETARESHPDWAIRKCKQSAEEIMDAGNSGSYDLAVSRLRTARDIYQQHHRQPEWEVYLDTLLENHHRKYKLVPMLRSIRV